MLKSKQVSEARRQRLWLYHSVRSRGSIMDVFLNDHAAWNIVEDRKIATINSARCKQKAESEAVEERNSILLGAAAINFFCFARRLQSTKFICNFTVNWLLMWRAKTNGTRGDIPYPISSSQLASCCSWPVTSPKQVFVNCSIKMYRECLRRIHKFAVEMRAEYQ